jgi:2,3-diketo-5-methylthio-1-phosphopentane phosphatase
VAYYLPRSVPDVKRRVAFLDDVIQYSKASRWRQGVRPVICVLDFDGTVTEKDIGDEICERFAPPTWRDIDAAWIRNEISLPEAQRQMWALARARREEAVAHARAVGRERPGLETLLARVTDVGGAVWLASGGFDFYIEALLGARLARFERAFMNRAEFVASDDGGRIAVSFPHAGTALGCARCAVCKGAVCALARHEAARVIFIGDGSSDRCALGRADRVWAVRGGVLERHARAVGAEVTSFTRLDEIVL